jgi:hypothetical protein
MVISQVRAASSYLYVCSMSKSSNFGDDYGIPMESNE